MKYGLGLCLLVLAQYSAAQTPSITGVVNAASGIRAGLPNGGIAEGAIFLIIGSNLGPAALSVSSSPFMSTTVGGTSARVTVNGVASDVLMYYTSAGQAAGLLPSSTQAGTGTITVTYNGAASAPVPITVVPNNLGIFTVAQNGSGPAIVTYPDYSFVSSVKAANPGDVLILWGTGLGPVKGDTAASQLGVDMPAIPVNVWLGGVQAPVSYRGRSGCCFGEDQIVFTVPTSVAPGCAIPLFIQIGNEISNTTFLPVASGGRSCPLTDPVLAALPAALLQQISSNVPFNYGQLALLHQFNPTGVGYNDNVTGVFGKYIALPGAGPFALTFLDYQPLGECVVFNTLNPTLTGPFAPLALLDAGLNFNVNGPGGARTVSVLNPFLSLTGNYLTPGNYTISGTGGVDIGAFTASLAIPQQPVWKDAPNGILAPLDRSKGVTFTWTGGAPGSIVEIDGASATDATNTNGATFSCLARAEAGTQFVPSNILLALPAGTAVFNFRPRTFPTAFSAPGLAYGIVVAGFDNLAIGSFQ